MLCFAWPLYLSPPSSPDCKPRGVFYFSAFKTLCVFLTDAARTPARRPLLPCWVSYEPETHEKSSSAPTMPAWTILGCIASSHNVVLPIASDEPEELLCTGRLNELADKLYVWTDTNAFLKNNSAKFIFLLLGGASGTSLHYSHLNLGQVGKHKLINDFKKKKEKGSKEKQNKHQELNSIM